MPRYVINVSSNGHRLFSTSRSSIGTDRAKLARLVNLFGVALVGAFDDQDLSMEVVLIGDATATTCMLNGDPLPANPPHDYAYGELPYGWERDADGDSCLMYADLGADHDTGIAASRFVIRVLRTGAGLVIGYSMTRDNEEVGHFASSYEAVEYAKTSKF